MRVIPSAFLALCLALGTASLATAAELPQPNPAQPHLGQGVAASGAAYSGGLAAGAAGATDGAAPGGGATDNGGDSGSGGQGTEPGTGPGTSPSQSASQSAAPAQGEGTGQEGQLPAPTVSATPGGTGDASATPSQAASAGSSASGAPGSSASAAPGSSASASASAATSASASASAAPSAASATPSAPAGRAPAALASAGQGGVRRFAGSDGPATRAALLRELFPSGADTVILVAKSDEGALAEAAALAGQLKAAFLPVGAALSAAEAAELKALAPLSVLTVGASAQVAAGVKEATGLTPTALGLADYLALLPNAKEIVAASGAVDAASGAALAARQGAILLSRPLEAGAAAALAQRGVERVTVVGGHSTQSAALRAALPQAAFTHLTGSDRVETAVKVARAGKSTSGAAVVVPALPAAEMLDAAYLAALTGAPLVHTSSSCLPTASAAFLRESNVGTRLLYGRVDQAGTAAATLPCGVMHDVAAGRYKGDDATGTSIALSKAAYGSGVHTVVLVGRNGVPDGPAAAPLATRLGGPVLVTGSKAMSAALLAELRRLAPSRILVLGSANSVSEHVLGQARQVAPTQRVAGANRQGTADAVAALFGRAQTAYVVGGNAMPDSIPASVAAARVDAPVLLAGGNEGALVERLRKLGVRNVVVVGGTSHVSAALASRIARETGAQVSRQSGADRFATARNVAANIHGATRYTFVGHNAQIDALAVSPIAAQLAMPVLYAGHHCQTRDHLDFVKSRGYKGRILLGGGKSLSTEQAYYVCGSLQGVPQNVSTCEPNLAGFRSTLPAAIRPWCPPAGLLAPTTRVTPISGGQVLYPGWNGTKVSLAQKALGLGSRWETMDATTISAVRSFQARRGLPVTGNVDQRTWNALGTGYPFTIDAWQTQPRLGARATRSERIETMIAFAMEQRGSEYTWGGAGPYQLGYDCSGLVLQALYAAGLDPQPINVMAHQWPEYRTSRELGGHPRMQRLPFSQRQRGDLIFYHNGRGVIDHVTIYLGDGKMIEAGGIALDTHVTSLRWTNYYPTVVRPFP
ncbi:cell wall-binding repeat-containing protein [Buchananella felis]|uniref:cell wall-binding repeat-containing protein n=1 Tax=Buchananella felis TaxID=3231492 RepID=UPI0035277ED5